MQKTLSNGVRISDVNRYKYLQHPTDEHYALLQQSFDSVNYYLAELDTLSTEANLLVLANSIAEMKVSVASY